MTISTAGEVASDSSTYGLSNANPDELRRLQGLEAALDPTTTRHLDSIGVKLGWRCLEVGGGAGSIARWLADRVGPSGHVTVIDLDPRFMRDLESDTVTVIQGDVTELDLGLSNYDLVHARLLVEHLAEPARAMQRLALALAPGGWMLIEDGDFITSQALTPCAAYDRVRNALFSIWGAKGAFQPAFGRTLPALMRSIGLRDVAAEGTVSFTDHDLNSPGRVIWSIMPSQFREQLLATGMVSDADIDDAIAFALDPTAEMMSPLVVSAFGRA